jgi:hypothetical protein
VSTGPDKLQLTALQMADLPLVLSGLSHRAITMEEVQRDLDAGMPVNHDGTVNLIEYVAWALAEEKSGDSPR